MVKLLNHGSLLILTHYRLDLSTLNIPFDANSYFKNGLTNHFNICAQRNSAKSYLRASFLLDSTFAGDMQGSSSSGFCPQYSHFAQRRDNYDGLLRKRGTGSAHHFNNV